MPFLHTHVHTTHSVRDGMLKLPELVRQSIANQETFAITDHGNISGWVEYARLAKENNIKPIFGVEIYLNQHRRELFDILSQIDDCKDAELKKQLGEERERLRKNNHLVLIAKNELGFYNIIALMNRAYSDYFYYRPLVGYDDLFCMKQGSDGRPGVIVTTACLASPFMEFMQANRLEEAINWVDMMQSHFGYDFYLEVQANDINEQRQLNEFIIQVHKHTGIPLTIGSDSHYLTQEDADTHQDLLLLQSKATRKDLGKYDLRIEYVNSQGELGHKKIDPDREFLTDYKLGCKPLAKDVIVGQVFGNSKVSRKTVTKIEQVSRVWTFSTDKIYFKSFGQIVEDIQEFHPELVPYITQLHDNNSEIYEKIESVSMNSKVKLPVVEGALQKLKDLIQASDKRDTIIDQKRLDRIKYELQIIKTFGFEMYFLILCDVIDWVKSNNIGLGNGRGSVAGSYIAYLLGLHSIDPFDERWDFDGQGLPFSRFLDESKLFDKITAVNENGETREYLANTKLLIQRNGKPSEITAAELQEGDEII